MAPDPELRKLDWEVEEVKGRVSYSLEKAKEDPISPPLVGERVLAMPPARDLESLWGMVRRGERKGQWF
jgi:hypothetical protein